MGYTIFNNLLITNLRLMNKVTIVDASDSDCRLMSGLLTRAGYESIVTGEMEVAKLSPGTVTVSRAVPSRYCTREVP